jgi:hypothetical protein
VVPSIAAQEDAAIEQGYDHPTGMMILLLAVLGFVGIVAGIFAIRFVGQYSDERASGPLATSGSGSPYRKAPPRTEQPVAKGRTMTPPRLAWVVGMFLGVSSWPLTAVMGYPYPGEREVSRDGDVGAGGRRGAHSAYAGQPGVGRVVGVPFMAAYFDAKGRDYAGPLTVPAALANSVFWALVPQLVLAGYILEKRRRGKGQMNGACPRVCGRASGACLPR